MKPRIVPSLLSGFAALLLATLPVRAERSGYAHVTDVDGSASVLSDANGRTEIQVNLPLAEGDQIVTNAGAHAEIELADGNRVQIAGESRVRLDALAGEEGSEARESAVTLLEGSLAAESAPFGDTRAFRIDTADTSVYVPAQGRVRVNLDANRGTSVVVRAGSADVQTRSGALTAEAGQYVLVHGDEQPELTRGSFSRDRFDIWVADRTETALEAYNSTSARYVDGQDYDQDVGALDNYGSWDYSSTYDTQVWRPDVPAGWSPYSDGYWYYTPAGATWVADEPWGWFPYHYGNWFFDAGFGSWCWSPAFAYSPAWVYWGFAPGWVGWCPIGYYSYYGPYASYWGGYGGWGSGLYFSVYGTFDCGHVDWGHGWSFVGSNHFGSHFGHHDVMPGSSVASRLGTRVAISSDPVRPGIVSGRGSAQTALRSFAQSAPATIAGRSSATTSAALAPFLARRSTLPASTVRTLQDQHLARVNASARRLEGPGAARLASPSRAAAGSVADSGRLGGGAFRNPGSPRSESWRAAPDARAGRTLSERAAPRAESLRTESPRAADAWRRPPSATSRFHSPSAGTGRSDGRSEPGGAWRERAAAPRTYSAEPPRPGNPSESWRTRANTPPAQRVIEGIDRGRAVASPRNDGYYRSLPERRSDTFAPRDMPAPRYERRAPPADGAREAAPPERYERRAPEPRMAPAPPSRFEPRSAPPPAREFRAPAPPPRSAAPAPRPAAPPPSRGGEYRPPHGRSP